ncbi:leucine-rich repeat-containing protein 59-like isoform X2 [Sesamum indicum]|uniref:Leucine-rich repeat-containing protein 59-like isoform X2 n=1 Tax=Sesamum indicum TaxID=4182 RepID=A0A8M8UZB0_SESIN|nr:leucine-rich repeat-containing protein 59-like isoform X2 [Sesamum indicum]
MSRKVLNAGKNKLKSMDEVKSLASLRALILNDNDISSVCKLDQMKELNTLVLSRNPISSLGDSLVKLKSITKLSLSNCQLQTVDSSLKSCLELKELRLAHNEIMIIPSEFGRLVKLQNLDMGNNLITNRSNIKVLSSLVNLRNLNLQGNPIAEKENLLKKVKKLLPNLHVFNARPIDKIVGKEMHEKVDDFSFEADNKLALRSETNIDQSSRNKNPSKTPPLSESMDNNLNSAGDLGSRKKRKELLVEKGVDSVENTNFTEKKKKTKVKLQQNENNNAESLNLTPEEAKKSKHKKQKSNQVAEELDVGLDRIATGKEPDKKSHKKTKGDTVNIIDSAETPFTDLFVTDAPEDLHEIADKKLDLKTSHDVHVTTGLVTLPAKKKKKRKRVDPAALELSQVDEIGLGGPSAWDDI